MGNSKSSARKLKSRRSKSRDFWAVMRAEKSGRGSGDGSEVNRNNTESPRQASPRFRETAEPPKKQVVLQNLPVGESQQLTEQQKTDLENSFHGQSKVKRIHSFGSMNDMAAGIKSAVNLEGSVHRNTENSVHREDWSYHGKADIVMEGISNHGSYDGSFNGGQASEYSISRSTRATRASELLMQPLSIDEATLSGIPHSSPVAVSTNSRKAQACCSRFGAGRDVIHQALQVTLEHICERFNWSYGEVWVVEEGVSMLRSCSQVSYQDPKLEQRLSTFRMACRNQIIESSSFLAGKPFENGGQHVWVPNLRMITQGVLATAPLARFNGLSSSVAIPVLAPSSNEILSYLLLYDMNSRKQEDPEMLAAVKATLGMVSDLLVAFVRFSRGKLNRDVYRAAMRTFLSFRVNSLGSEPSWPAGPKPAPSPEADAGAGRKQEFSAKMELEAPPEDREMEVDAIDSMHAAPIGATNKDDVDLQFSPPNSPAKQVDGILDFDGTDIAEVDTVRVELKSRVLFEVGIVEQHLSWAHSMDSIDHKMAIQVLSWLAHYYNVFKQSFSVAAFKEVEMLLKYLAETSPLLESESPVRKMAQVALDKLVVHGVMTEADREPPFFGRVQASNGFMSPVRSNIEEFRARLKWMFENHPRRQKLETLATSLLPKSVKLLDFRVGEVFNTIGQRAAATVASSRTQGNGMWGNAGRRGGSAQKPGEAKRAADICTTLLRASQESEIVTVENMFKLHKAFDLTQVGMNGKLRTTLAVGSHRFFESYRVFAPCEEIETLMEDLEQFVSSEEYKNWNPVQKAFFVFGALVWFIHPFVDGNGRTARLFGNLILKQHGFPPVIRSTDKVLNFEDFCELVVEKYEALQAFLAG